MARTTTGRPSRQATRRPSRHAAQRGRFVRAGQPPRRRIPQRQQQRQRSQGIGGPLGQLTRFAPGLLGKLTGGSGRGRGGRGGGLPVNAKVLTGLLGAGVAGTALARKRRARRGQADAEAGPPLPTSGPESDEEHEVVLHEEEPVVEKRTVPKERVRMEKDSVTDEAEVSEEVRKERIEAEGDTNR